MFVYLLKGYTPWLPTIPLHQGMTWDPTWKTLPTFEVTRSVWKRMGLKKETIINIRSSFTSLAYELSSWQFLLTHTHAYGEQWSQGCLWPPRTRFAFDSNNKLFTGSDLDWFESRIGPYLPTCDQVKAPPVTGRLGQSLEGGGKRRIFAIGNYINQRLLRPVHDWLIKESSQKPMFIVKNETFTGKIKEKITNSL